jgi:HEAT repeat protein
MRGARKRGEWRRRARTSLSERFASNGKCSISTGDGEHSNFMAKPRLGLKIGAAMLIAGMAVWMIRHFSEPSYNGKVLSAWLLEAERSGEVNQFWTGGRQPDSQAAQAIRAIGTAGLPTLVSLVRVKDTSLRKKLRDFARDYKWIPIDPHDSHFLAGLGLYGFWVLGPVAKPAVPDLIASLDDDNAQVRSVAAYAISLTGSADIAALPALEKRLNLLCQTKSPASDWDLEAYCVLHALGEIGPPAQAALPQIALLSQPSSQAIGYAKAAHIKITGEGLDSAIAPLKDPSAITNWRLAWVVARELGTNAAAAVPLLAANLQSTNQEVQERAVEALGRIRRRPDLCLPAIVGLLSSSNNSVRRQSLVVISAFGRAATQWVSTSEITRCLIDPDELTRRAATNALFRLAPEAAVEPGGK